jgi:hypothetical protein
MGEWAMEFSWLLSDIPGVKDISSSQWSLHLARVMAFPASLDMTDPYGTLQLGDYPMPMARR